MDSGIAANIKESGLGKRRHVHFWLLLYKQDRILVSIAPHPDIRFETCVRSWSSQRGIFVAYLLLSKPGFWGHPGILADCNLSSLTRERLLSCGDSSYGQLASNDACF